uniref:Similar to tetrapyrrole methylase family protein n=1 Tax=Arundo donax TaxID=35708 RepID=A0A0A9DLV8_ARUDO
MRAAPACCWRQRRRGDVRAEPPRQGGEGRGGRGSGGWLGLGRGLGGGAATPWEAAAARGGRKEASGRRYGCPSP